MSAAWILGGLAGTAGAVVLGLLLASVGIELGFFGGMALGAVGAHVGIRLAEGVGS